MTCPAQARFSASVLSMLSARPKRRRGRKQELSAYVNFWMARAAALLLAPPPARPNAPNGREGGLGSRDDPGRQRGGIGGGGIGGGAWGGLELRPSLLAADAMPSGGAASVMLALERAGEANLVRMLMHATHTERCHARSGARRRGGV